MSAGPSPSTRDRIVTSCLEAIGTANPAELLEFFRAKDAATAAFCARTTAVNHFKGPTGNFDHNLLLEAALARVAAELPDLSRQSVRGYDVALGSARRDRSIQAFVEAFRRNFADFDVSDDPAANGRERLYYLAMAFADTSASCRAQLDSIRSTIESTYAPIYDGFCSALGRRWNRPGDRKRFQTGVSRYLEGATLLRRAGSSTDDAEIAEDIVRLFISYTSPRRAPVPPKPFDLLFAEAGESRR